MNKKYYHGSFPTDAKIEEMIPDGFYEKVGEGNGCPQPIYTGGGFIGFPTSKIPELSFSKSKSGAILGKGRWCEEDSFITKNGKKICKIDIYETTEKPDADISHCNFDFGELEEVRYRKKISVKKIETFHLSERFVNQLGKAYHSDWDESWGEPPSEPDTWLLGYLKEHISEHIRRRQKFISGLTDYEMDKCFAEGENMTVEGYRKSVREYEDAWKK